MQNYNRIISQLNGKQKRKGNEVSFEICPMCGGGKHRDKYTFSINSITGAYNCLRGSCGASGHVVKLAKERNLYIEKGEYMKNTKFENIPKVYSKPKEKINEISSEIYEYFEKRGISSKIVMMADIKVSKNGEIVYNGFDENNHICYRKFKNYKTTIRNKRFRAETDGKQVFFLQNKIEKDVTDLIITEGEEDCLSLWEVGFDNIVSLPFGANSLDCITNSWDWLQRFETVIIWTDSDEAGKKSRIEINERLKDTHDVKFIESKFKDANEVLTKSKNPFNEIEDLVGNAEFIDKDNMILLSEVGQIDYNNLENVKSSFSFINRNTHGGYRKGEVVLWTGYQGSGKSTVLSQELTFAIIDHEYVGIYTSETSSQQFADTLYKQVVGAEYIEEVKRYDAENADYKVNDNVFHKVRNIIGNRIRIVRSDFYGDYNSLFGMFKKARRRYGIKTFVIDNLMTLIPHNDNIYQAQTAFFISSQKFVKELGVTLHIVAHQRKPKIDKTPIMPSEYSILGSSNIINLVNVCIGVGRVADDSDEKELKKYELTKDDDGVVAILKERLTGRKGIHQKVFFEEKSKRFSENWNDLNYKIKWEEL